MKGVREMAGDRKLSFWYQPLVCREAGTFPDPASIEYRRRPSSEESIAMITMGFRLWIWIYMRMPHSPLYIRQA